MAPNKHRGKAKIHYLQTSDGWKIALHRHQGKGAKHPVLLVHGLASNAANLDFPIKDLSLARYLKKNGYDAWVVDLRGSGLSKKKRLTSIKWYFDDYLFKDLPATVDYILKQTKARKIHYVGHSLGGILAFPFNQTYHHKKILKSLITVGTPMAIKTKPGYFKYLFRIDNVLKFIPWVPYKTASKLAHVFSEYLLGLDDHHLFSKNNMTPEIFRTMLRHAVESVPSSLILQIHSWIRNSYFGSLDGTINFMENIQDHSMPVMMIVGSIDTFTPPSEVRLAFRRLPGEKKTLKVFGKKHGHRNEYGHIDLILGKHAPQEVFPHILEWMDSHD